MGDLIDITGKLSEKKLQSNDPWLEITLDFFVDLFKKQKILQWEQPLERRVALGSELLTNEKVYSRLADYWRSTDLKDEMGNMIWLFADMQKCDLFNFPFENQSWQAETSPPDSKIIRNSLGLMVYVSQNERKLLSRIYKPSLSAPFFVDVYDRKITFPSVEYIKTSPNLQEYPYLPKPLH